MGNVYAVISGKGGTGKSTVSVGLATAFTKHHKKVLLIDLDSGLRCLDTLLGIDKDIVFDLGDWLDGSDLEDVVYSMQGNDNLFLIPAPQKITDISSVGIFDLISHVSACYDVVILDFPAGIDIELIRSVGSFATFFAVCNPDPISVKDASAVCDVMVENDLSVRLILNRFTVDSVKKRFNTNIDDIIDNAGARLLGIVPQSEILFMLSMTHRIASKSYASDAFDRIARRLIGEAVPLPDPKKI